jgi:hypothetical protein
MPPHGETFLDDHAAARTGLAGVGRRYGYHSLPGTHCLESEEAQESTPARVTDALGEMMVPEQVGRPQVLVIDRVVLPDEYQCRLVVEVLPLPTHRLMRLRKQLHGLAAPVAPLLAP